MNTDTTNPRFDWPTEDCPDCGGSLPNGCSCGRFQ